MKVINCQHFLSPTEAAEILGVTRRTIIRWCSNGSNGDRRPANPPNLYPVRGPNRRLYFHEERIRSLAAQFFGNGHSDVQTSFAVSSPAPTDAP